MYLPLLQSKYGAAFGWRGQAFFTLFLSEDLAYGMLCHALSMASSRGLHVA